MSTELDNLVAQYISWLKDRTSLRPVGDWYEITTPFLDRHNDYLQIYAKKVNGDYVLTDDSYTIQDLKMSGCDLESEKRMALLRQTLNGFAIESEGDALITYATPETFPLRKHNLVQAMLAVDDLFYLSQPSVASLFIEDVAKWLDEQEVRYIPNVKLTGRSGFDYQFDFVVPKSREHPERLISTINYPDRKSAQKLFTAWLDTKDARPADAEAFAFVNDTDKRIPTTVEMALRKYEITPIPWSRKEEFSLALAE
jgi:hypothetical protein